MSEIIYSYRKTLPQKWTKVLEGDYAKILARKLFGDKIDNHTSIVVDNVAFHWSDGRLYCDCQSLLAGDCNREIKCLELVWTKEIKS